MALSTTYPTWWDFFIHCPTAGSLNNKTGTVLHAAINPTSDIPSHFNYTLFSDYCALAYSSLPGHVVFLHHFQTLANRVLNPSGTHNIALFSLLDHTKANPDLSFQSVNMEILKIEVLLEISSVAQLNYDSTFYAISGETTTHHMLLTGFIFIPPLLQNGLSNLNCSITGDVYLQAIQSIKSWATSLRILWTLPKQLTLIKLCLYLSHHCHSPQSSNRSGRVTILPSNPSEINPLCIASIRIRNCTGAFNQKYLNNKRQA